MHLRKLTLTAGLVGALCSTWAYGLGLGEITLNSTLNQPLDAEIKLLQVRNLAEEDIVVGLAAADDFQRFGVERIFFLQDLKFDVQLDHPAGPIVRVTTSQAVREPYLIFLLEAESANGGRLLREYTLLMDLPVFADESAQPVQGVQTRPEPRQTESPAPRQPAAQTQPPRAEPRPAVRQGEPSRAQPAPQRSVSSQSSGEAYSVQANDTLWEIAQRVRPSSQISVQQTMLALQRSNPDAFINGNINLLKRGQVLRIPEESEFRTLDQRAAVNQVAQQNDQWSAGRSGQVAGPELDASPSRPAARTETQSPRGQLTLAAPGNADNAGERSGAGDTSARTEALENELAITSEELDASQRENQELSTRVAELEEQISTMERLIEVSNEELRAMQLAAEQGQQASDGEPVVAEISEAEIDATAAADTETEAAENGEQASAEESPQPVAQPTRVVTPQPAAQPSMLDLLMANLWYLLIALLAIIGGVVYFLHRRSQAAEMQAFEAEDELFADLDEPEEAFDTLEESAGLDEHVDFGDEDREIFEEDTEEQELPVESETGDAVGEADIYIAYGKLDQAEEMLQKAIIDDPNHMEARLKLLEVYAEGKDIDKFDREYGQLISLADPDTISRAAGLRGNIPGAGQFGEGGGVGGSESPGEPAAEPAGFDSSELTLDSEEDLDATPAGESASSSHESDSEGELDDLMLDLDDDARDFSTGTEDEKASSASLDDDDISFDFDLDLGEDGESDAAVEEDRKPVGELDLSEEFEADTALEKTDGEPDTGELDDLDFSLDLDSPAADTLSLDGNDDESPTLTEVSDGEDDTDFALDLDLPSLETEGLETESLETEGLETGSEGDSDLDLSLDLDDSFASKGGDKATDSEQDIFSDLEFNTPEADPADRQVVVPEASELSLDSSREDDDFDMDMGDMDLEALDQEMDALVGSEDLDDDDVAVATPTGSVPVLNKKTAAAASDEFDLDDFASNLASNKVAGDEPDSAETFAFGEDQDFDLEESGLDGDLDSELDFLSDADEVATKLDLARAYIDMGDQDGAKDILEEVSGEGNDEQKREAAELLGKMV